MSPMKILVLVVLVVCNLFAPVVNAQDKNMTNSEPRIMRPFHPSLPVMVGIIFVMLSVTFLVLAYARFCHVTQIEGMARNARVLIRSRSRFSGIDEAAIDSLPFFRFSSLKGSKEGLECAVCISRFEDNEILRLLPKCKHAFHRNCIDQWLKSHSTCPLCRYKVLPQDIKSINYSNSWRCSRNPSDLTEDPNLELFVEREQDNNQGSSRFNLGIDFQSNGAGKDHESLIDHESDNVDRNRKILHKFKHKIIVSDVVTKNRWSDVNSSDLLSLSSDMLNVMSGNRFSPTNSSSLCVSINTKNIKEDTESKTLYNKSGIVGTEDSSSLVSGSNFPSNSSVLFCNEDENSWRKINRDEKRSMSEITNVSRFTDLSTKNKSKESASPRHPGKEENIRRLWLPIARRTLHWFASQNRNSQELSKYQRHVSNV